MTTKVLRGFHESRTFLRDSFRGSHTFYNDLDTILRQIDRDGLSKKSVLELRKANASLRPYRECWQTYFPTGSVDETVNKCVQEINRLDHQIKQIYFGLVKRLEKRIDSIGSRVDSYSIQTHEDVLALDVIKSDLYGLEEMCRLLSCDAFLTKVDKLKNKTTDLMIDAPDILARAKEKPKENNGAETELCERYSLRLSRNNGQYLLDILDDQQKVVVRKTSNKNILDGHYNKIVMASELVDLGVFNNKDDARKALTRSFAALRGGELPEEDAAEIMPKLGREEYEKAIDMLKGDDYLYKLNKNLFDLKIAGEERERMVVYVAAVSSKLTEIIKTPPHIFVRSESGSGKTYTIEQVLKSIPEEIIIKANSLSATSLRYLPGNLNGKVVYVEEWTSLSKESAELLRPKLSGSEKKSLMPVYEEGTRVTKEVGPEGIPVFMAASTANQIEEELMNRCWIINTDLSKAQTKKVLDYQAESGVVSDAKDKEFDQKRKQYINCYKVLTPVKIANPFAFLTSKFMNGNIADRRHNNKLQNFIKSVTFLHQYQRENLSLEGEIYKISTLADIYMSIELLKPFFNESLTGISRDSKSIYDLTNQEFSEGAYPAELVSKLSGGSSHVVDDLSDKHIHDCLNELSGRGLVTEEGNRYKPNVLSHNIDFNQIEFCLEELNSSVKRLVSDGDYSKLEGTRFCYLPETGGFDWQNYKENVTNPVTGEKKELAIEVTNDKCRLVVR